jgi:hypothetical protein
MDLAIHPRTHDLIVATHGRAIWIVDDISPLRTLDARSFDEPLRVLPSRAVAPYWQPPEDGGFGFGAGEFRGANRPYGAYIDFVANGAGLPIADEKRERERKVAERQAMSKEEAPAAAKAEASAAAKAEAAAPAGAEAGAAGAREDEKAKEEESDKKKATIEIRDAGGALVRTLEVEPKRGLNRVAWNLGRDAFRSPPPAEPEEESPNPSGPELPPGSYDVTVKLDGRSGSTRVDILPPANAKNTPEDWNRRWQAILSLGELRSSTVEAIERIRATRSDLDAVAERIKLAHAEEIRTRKIKADELPLAAEAKPLRERLETIEQKLWWPADTVGITPDTDVWTKLAYVSGYLLSTWDPPSAAHLEYLRQARLLLDAALAEWNGFEAKELAAFRARVAAQKIELLPAREPIRIR